MKHGDKEKGKASKAAGKKSSKAAAGSKGSKAAPVAKSQKQQAGPAAKSAAKAPAEQAGGNGKARPRPGGDVGGFTNPVVAAAFKRAVKKYPNTFRKLSD